MAEFYLKPDAKLFDKVAKDWSKEIYGDKKDPLTNKNQIRNFYEKVLKYHNLVDKKEQTFDEVLPFIKMINAQIEYARGRKTVKGAFGDFMKKGIENINSEEELKNFKLLFEAVIGFFIGLDLDKKGQR